MSEPEPIHECVVCGVSLWHTASDLCYHHARLRQMHAANPVMQQLRHDVERGRYSDFYMGWNHQDAQLRTMVYRPIHWMLVVGDLMDRARYWLRNDDSGRAA
jgi:hypothetical protein